MLWHCNKGAQGLSVAQKKRLSPGEAKDVILRLAMILFLLFIDRSSSRGLAGKAVLSKVFNILNLGINCTLLWGGLGTGVEIGGGLIFIINLLRLTSYKQFIAIRVPTFQQTT